MARSACLIAIACLLAGCAEKNAPPARSSVKLADASKVTIDIVPPSPAKQLVDNRFSVHVMESGKPASRASVTISLRMAEMMMPPNVVKCREVSQGYYSGVGTFTMSGSWRLDAKAVTADGTSAEASRQVVVR